MGLREYFKGIFKKRGIDVSELVQKKGERHKWLTANVNHRESNIIYLCANCDEQHVVRTNNMFNTEEHHELLDKNAGPCTSEKTDLEHIDLGGEA